MSIWNPWHGCTRLSRACAGCIVFQTDAAYGRNTTLVRKTKTFDLPIKKNRKREYRLMPKDGIVETLWRHAVHPISFIRMLISGGEMHGE